MKKIFLILAVLLSFGTMKAAVFGDVNGDGIVTAADITAIYDLLLGSNNSSNINADVNGDNVVTAADITFFYDILLGNISPEPKRGKIYICDNASWGDMALYAWPDQGLNGWPGIHYSGTTEKDGKTYYRFDLSDGYYGRALNYIANNYAAVNGGTNRQLDLMSDHTMGENDIYLTINDGAKGSVKLKVIDANPFFTLKLEPDNGWQVSSLTLNGENVKAEMTEDGTYTTPAINSNLIIIRIRTTGSWIYTRCFKWVKISTIQ